jgi:NHL repeat-containing protein/WD40 repeat protein
MGTRWRTATAEGGWKANRRAFTLLGVSLCVALACASARTAPARAGGKHVFEGSFCGEGAGPGQCERPIGVAVNSSTHDVYVVDSGNNRVEQFTATGEFVRVFPSPPEPLSEPTQIAVDNSGSQIDPSREDVYVVDLNHKKIDKFSAEGLYEGSLTGTTCEAMAPEEATVVLSCPKNGAIHPFGTLVGVAVDPNGALWTDEEEGSVDSFTDGQPNEPATLRLTVFGGGIFPGLAIDEKDDIYIKPRRTAKTNSAGELETASFCGEETSLAVSVDTVHATAYVDNIGSERLSTISECNLAGDSIENFGLGHLQTSLGVAVDTSEASEPGEPAPFGSQSVYVSSRDGGSGVSIFRFVLFPTVTAGALTEQTPHSVTLNGSVNPEGHAVTACWFEYDTKEYAPGEPEHKPGEPAQPGAHGVSVPCAPSGLGSGSAPVPVITHLEGLAPKTQYFYRILAENSAGTGSSCEQANERCQEFYTGPLLSDVFVTSVTSSSATLHGAVDPNGEDTHYYVEYGTDVSYGSFVPAAPPGVDLGSASGVQKLELHLQGLQASTTYHYRLVAEQAGELFEEQDRTFTTQPATQSGLLLPDGRAWELVSPADKKGALIDFFVGYNVALQAANDGSRIAYEAAGQLGEGPVGKSPLSYVFSSRAGERWASRDLTLPESVAPEEEEPANIASGSAEYIFFSSQLSSAVVEPHQFTPPLAPGVSERTLYLRNMDSGSFTALVTAQNTPAGTLIGKASPEPMRVYVATPDLAHLVLRAPVALTESAYSELYEWGGGRLSPVGVLPGGEPYQGSMSIAGAGGEFGSAQRAISNDGRWIAWTAGDPYDKPNVALYVRDMVGETTAQIGGANARYQTMSSDGSKIFYLEGGDLHQFETATGASTDLTPNHGPEEASAGVREAVSDVSENGSYLYFVADGVLTAGTGEAEPKAGQPNLYVLHEQGGETTLKYIATLSAEDEKSWHGWAFGSGTSATWLSSVTSRVSPDGRYLAFMSQRSLTGYDNLDAASGAPDEEVYLYDASAERLVCASCNPTGERPHGIHDEFDHEPLVDRRGLWSGRGGEGREHWLAGSVPGWDEGVHSRSMYQPRYLSDSGRLFFDSPDALVPQATNGVEDVYEYEPPGVGDCTSASVAFSRRSEGCVNLISSGISSAESGFYDASENGDDVFFITASKLVREDYDGSYDVYDAHVCSAAVPCRQAPEAPPPCDSGDSCKGAPSPQPEIFGPPPTATFSGAGNVVAPAAKGGGAPTQAQKLARALRACRRHRADRRRRARCERQARRRYRQAGRASGAGPTRRRGR